MELNSDDINLKKKKKKKKKHTFQILKISFLSVFWIFSEINV